MTEPEPHKDTLTPDPSPGGRGEASGRRDWLLIGLLVALVLPLRLWLLHNTEVTARDSIGYIRYARDFEYARTGPPACTDELDLRKWPTDWKFVLNKYHQHPGYSVLVWLTSLPVRALDGGEMTPENMEYSAQLVNFFASLLLILPMYFAGRLFFSHSTAFFGTLLYQYLPVSAHHLSDAISEPVFLLLLVSALLQAFHALRSRHLGRFALCGFFTGLAYLTRPEGLLVLPAFGLVLIAAQLFAAHRCAWRRFVACGMTMVLATMMTGYIYYHATGKLSNKPTVTIIKEQRFLSETAPNQAQHGGAHLFAVTFPEIEHRGLRFVYSMWALCMEVNQGFHYVAGIPMLLGLWWSFGMLRRDPAYWMIMTFGAVHGLILVALAMSVCYVSDRHVMILVLGWSYFAVYGLQELPRRVLAWWKIDAVPDASTSFGRTWCRSATAWFAILFLALMVFCLPKSTHRLHGNRAANHAAGIWLGEHFKVGDHIEDDHNWSEYFAGFTFREYDVPRLPPDHVPTSYVVTTRSRDPQVNADRAAAAITSKAKIVFVWPQDSDLVRARVVVYAQPRDFKKNPWHKAP